jgi:hypothetical protein
MDEDFEPEPYQNDLEDRGNQEAWEDSQADMREHYEDEECPYCGEEIPEGTTEGEECKNCGHVFCSPKENDDEIQRELEAEGKQDRELSEYENDTPLGQAFGDGFEE